MSKERPILFNGEMVRAILAGRKVQTRRAVKPAPMTIVDGKTTGWNGEADALLAMLTEQKRVCPFGQPGDRLWVRESFRIGEDLGEDWDDGMDVGDRFPIYQADGEHGRYGVVPLEWEPPRNAREAHNSEGTAEHWRSFGPIPSIHMPRWACRLVLEITAVRVERLHAISEADAVAEGARNFPDLPMGSPSASPCRWSMEDPKSTDQCLSTARYAFANQFCKQYGTAPKGVIDQRPWDSNPWVWVIEFKKVTP